MRALDILIIVAILANTYSAVIQEIRLNRLQRYLVISNEAIADKEEKEDHGKDSD